MGTYTDLVKQGQGGQQATGSVVPRPAEKHAAIEVKQSNRDTTIPRHHDTTVSRSHDSVVEPIRRAVKEFGKEAATHRFTLAEKRALADIIHAYKGTGVKTSENEIARIAINFIVADYKQHGDNSVLEQVLRALNA